MRGNEHIMPLVIHIQLTGLNVNMYWASKTVEFKLLIVYPGAFKV
jgi:hypothetical protein